MKLKKTAGLTIAGLVVIATLAGCPGKEANDEEDTLNTPVDTADIEVVEPDTGLPVIDTSSLGAGEDPDSVTDTEPKPDPGPDRKAAPDFTLKDMSGKSHTVSAYKGKVVLLDFWATWCGPCKKEIPHLEAIYNKYKSQGFAALGIGLDKESNLERYLSKTPIAYTVLVDEKGVSGGLYGISGIPRTILIDKKGRIAYDHTGYRPGMENQIEQEVTSLLAEEY
ncbi:redoxin domain-containing protein [candidate division WOR-3 bacterium]|uniref:Redoxin domain-containing protein n=1 Tax=candidate division WOR-3 bacterium TaxID=2052148 RepID=A0A9D5KB05_UNCW3|nr:redoxin domain-containing protein [candidate division WOR-3 bacterium]MBD3365424.1 redoxin domain-containing protein [candidate division WOR-3 bacterium]